MRHWINSLRPTKHNGRHFADDTFKSIFLDKNGGISIKISLKFVHKCPINNIPALVQMMAWRRPGNNPLSETMVVRLPTYIFVTRPQWVNENRPYYLHPCRSWWMPFTWVFSPNKPWWRHQMETKERGPRAYCLGMFCGGVCLTHWGRNKMATICADNIFKLIICIVAFYLNFIEICLHGTNWQ